MTLGLGAASVHCHIQNISYSTELGKYFHVKEGRITTCVISPCFNHNKQRRIRLFLPARTPFLIIFQMVLWQTDSPRPGVDGQAKPRWVRRGRRFGNHYHLFPSLVAGLKKLITGTQKHIQQAYGTSAPACVRCLFFFLTCLASVDAVVILRRVAAAMFGFVVEFFLQVIHAPLTAWAEGGRTPCQRQRPELVCKYLKGFIHAFCLL